MYQNGSMNANEWMNLLYWPTVKCTQCSNRASYLSCNRIVNNNAFRKHYTYHDTLHQSNTQNKQNVANPFIVFNICTPFLHIIHFKRHRQLQTRDTTMDHLWAQLPLALNVSVPFSISVSPIDDYLVLPCCATEKFGKLKTHVIARFCIGTYKIWIWRDKISWRDWRKAFKATTR